jgi:F-type H+-transporting ATPase subunit b
MRLPLLLLALVAALLPAVALAGGDAHAAAPGPDWGSIVRHTVNLVVLLGLLYTFLKRPVGDFLKFRRNEVKDQLEASAGLKSNAEAKYAELQDRLSNFENDLQTMMDAVAADAVTEQESLLAQAEKSAAQVVAAARLTVDEELRRARTALQAEAVELAVNMARQALTEAVGKDDQTRLNAAYLAQVEGSDAR